MVCEWGMSDMGPLTYGKKEEQIFLGREIAQHRDYSEDTAIRIDREVREMVESSSDTATKILSENLQALHDMANALLERETIVREDIREIIGKDKAGSTADAKSSTSAEHGKEESSAVEGKTAEESEDQKAEA